MRNKFIVASVIFSLTTFIILGLYAFYYLYQKPMNLVIVSIDALRSDHLGRYGYNKATSFYIDKWSKRGVVFTNAYTVAPITYPSFLALMTGKGPLETGIVNNALEKNPRISGIASPTLAEILNKRGYQTAAFVTNKFIGKELSPLHLGFKEFYEMDETTTHDELIYFDYINKAVDWIPKNKNAPFFLWIHLMDPHNPYKPSTDLQCIFNTKYCKRAQENTEITNESKRAELEGCQNTPLPEEEVEYFKTLYDGEIKSADLRFEEIIRSLRDNGLFNNTVVVVYGDHGEGFDHGYYFKHGDVLYDSAIRIPLMIINPRLLLTKNRFNDSLVQNTDIFNTLLNMLHIPAQKLPDSVSFASQLPPSFLDNGSRREEIFSVNREMNKFALIKNGYKYIYSENGSCLNNDQKEELYFLLDDPREENNLANKPEAKKLVEEYRSVIQEKKFQLQNQSQLNPTQTPEIMERLKSLGY